MYNFNYQDFTQKFYYFRVKEINRATPKLINATKILQLLNCMCTESDKTHQSKQN